MTTLLFNIANSLILLLWALLIFLPKWKFTKTLIGFPWVPLVLSVFYIYFLSSAGGLVGADFSSLDGITALFKNATPDSAAAGWMHYLAFDYWVGCWIIRHSQKREIPHWAITLPLLFTFLLGPVGVLLYGLVFGLFQLKKGAA